MSTQPAVVVLPMSCNRCRLQSDVEIERRSLTFEAAVVQFWICAHCQNDNAMKFDGTIRGVTVRHQAVRPAARQ